MTLRENSEWLRYWRWVNALGLCFFVAGFNNAAVNNIEEIISSVTGVFLFGFGGFAFQSQKSIIDPLPRGLRNASRDRIPRVAVLPKTNLGR